MTIYRDAAVSGHRGRRAHSERPWKMIVADDPNTTLGDGNVRHFVTLLDAVNAFIKADEPYRQIIFDDGCQVRELDEREHALLDHACSMLGLEVDEIEGG